jgi:Lon protease-like protein
MTPSSAHTTTLELPLVVLRNQTLFPGDRAELDVTRARSVGRVESLARGATLALVRQADPSVEEPGAAGLDPIGVLVRIEERRPRATGGHHLVVVALERLRIGAVEGRGPDQRVRATGAEPAPHTPAAAEARRLDELVGDLRAHLPPPVAAALDTLAVPAACDWSRVSRALDLVADACAVSVEERAELLGAVSLAARLERLAPLVERKRTWAHELSRFVVPTGDALTQLWPLAPDGLERIARERAAGRITAEEERDLVDYAVRGFVLWEKLVPEAEVDALVSDVRSIAELPGHFLSTDHRRGFGYRFTDRDFDAYESVFDCYVNFESARRMAFQPRVLRFLELLFQAPPIAMQQLLFQRSNQHPLHQDTAYVRVQQPLHLSATWIALEDVVEGRGELVYYEGSHRIPHQLFRGGMKWFDLEHDDAAAATRYVTEQSERLGCQRRAFLAKKGDVFLWAADLVHGSAPRTRPDHETRLSCVTHYVPHTAQPLWFMFAPDRRGLEPYGERAFLASSHYELPRRTPGLQRPTFKGPLPC